MKVTVAILNKNFRVLKGIINKAFILFLIVVSIFILSPFIKRVHIPAQVMNFATNLRQADKLQISTKNLMSVYPIFNASNYIVDKSTDNGDKEQIQKTSTESSGEVARLDEMVANKNMDDISVFLKSNNISPEISDSSSVQRISVFDMKLLNYSSNRNLNFQEMFNKVITLTKKSDSILLYNTHTSESYSNSDNYKFDYTGTYRTTDSNYNVLKVADELQKNLAQKEVQVTHNTTPHDYGTYVSSYSRSRKTVTEALKSMGNVGISIDVHRDAVADLAFRPVVTLNGVQVAQCMFVIGLGTDTQKNPYWEDNLSLALQLQKIADDVYPGLFRPMIIRDSVYNQDLNDHSLLIEFGATGNTLDEVLLSTRCVSNILNIFYKN